MARQLHQAEIVPQAHPTLVISNTDQGRAPARLTAPAPLPVPLSPQEALIAGCSHKVPKVAAACVDALAAAFGAFGPKVLAPQPILKALPPLFDSKDAKASVVWCGCGVVWSGDVAQPTLPACLPSCLLVGCSRLSCCCPPLAPPAIMLWR